MDSGGMLSQDEINALLSGMLDAGEPASEESPVAEDDFIDENLLTDVEKDAIGDVIKKDIYQLVTASNDAICAISNISKINN